MSNSKILLIHRAYRNRGGEDAFLDDILTPALGVAELEFELLLLPPLGFRSGLLSSIAEIFGMMTGFEGLRPSLRHCLARASQGGFTHVILNNCIPTISLRLPRELRKQNIKTIAWVHNFRLDCANGFRFTGRNFCRRCLDDGSRWSLIQNCQRNFIQSFIYALAYRGQRVAQTFIPFIDRFVVNSDFTKLYLGGVLQKLNLSGASSVIVMPVAPASGVVKPLSLSSVPKPFYLFLGRLNYDKGADLFLELARKYPDRGFVACGEGPMLEDLKKVGLKNLVFLGNVGPAEKPWLFENCEALIVTSRYPETSSLVISESHSYGTPVVYPRGGGAEETFRRLGRVGCPIDEFKGQQFSKSVASAVKGTSLNDFASSLSNVISELR
jgi:glycosyltransferase involved in cell wall biosynthesis